MHDSDYFLMLKLSVDDLSLEIHHEKTGLVEEESLAWLLDRAVELAAYDGDWQGLVRLRKCLLEWADEAGDALIQIAREGPYRDKVEGECASPSAP